MVLKTVVSRTQREGERIRKARILGGMYLRSLQRSEIGIFGAYATGNIGDRAIGEALKSELTHSGYSTALYSNKLKPRKTNINVLGGGGVIHDYSREGLKRCLSVLDSNSMVIGVGADPILDEEAQELVTQAFNDVQLITVRDERSKIS